MVSSASAVEEAALKNGLSLKKAPKEDETNSPLKNGGVITDESSQNSVSSEKGAGEKTQNGGTNGDHKKELDDDDDDYEVQEFSEPEELVIEEDLDNDETEQENSEADKPKDKTKTEDEDDDNEVEAMETDVATSENAADDDKPVENDENRPNVQIVKDVRRLDKGLPKFLNRRVQIGRWLPYDMPKNGELQMRDTEALVEATSLTVPFLIKEKDTFARRVKDGKPLPPKPRKAAVIPQNQLKVGQATVVDFFTSSAGEFLMELGLDRVKEQVNKDMIKQKEREMRRHGKSAELLESAKKHAETFQVCKAKNAAFHHKLKRCQTCDFKTESQLVLEGHLLTPHFTQRRELQCSFCPFITRDAKAIIFHMEAHHNKVPVMEPPPQFYECPFCPFETNLKNKAGTHVNRCQRHFNENVNQTPAAEFQAPGITSKLITNEDIKLYERCLILLSQSRSQIAQAQAAQAAQAAQNASTAQQRQQLLMAAAASRGNSRGSSSALYQQLQNLAAASRTSQSPSGRSNNRNSQPQNNFLQTAHALAGGLQAASLMNNTNGLSVTALGSQNRPAASTGSLARLPQQLDANSGSAANGVSDSRAPKDLYVDEHDYKYKFKQFCPDGSSRWCCTNRKCKAAFVIPRGESKPRFSVGPDTHNHKAYKVAEPLDAGSHAVSQLAAAGVNMQALVALTNGGQNAQALLNALNSAACGAGPQSAQAQALLTALGGKDAAATKLAQAAAAVGAAAAGASSAPNTAATSSADDGVVPDKAELVPGVATRLSAPGTGRAPLILESSGQGSAGTQNAAFVICEICDGYIKDLDQLRTHMQWIHKVKIHPKMLASRPPLSCQKCQWRFFTDQGLERHLLGAHGLVTSNMQELANNNQDGGRCTVCGRIYASKLVAHMSQVHRVVLKPAHLSYKCTVCTATFNLYKLFESHVYSVHSGAMKRGSTSDQSASKRKKEDHRKEDVASSKSREESQATNNSTTASATTNTSNAGANAYPTTCSHCDGIKVDDWLEHLADKHMPKNVRVGVCQIMNCSTCLKDFDGMVLVSSDNGESSSSDDDDDDEEEE